ncbi:sugar transferase [Acidobacterium sp. S8]|uniref:sugar transferase n=1 Tax=Acidobacterium sp. S8 TaxID=1641854 RepID=UPI00131D0C1C|nr:sugar transferase [Acidobacterium sp. S8]
MSRQKPRTLITVLDSLAALTLAVSAVVWANQLYMPPGTFAEFLAMRITLLNALFAIVFAVCWAECSEAFGLFQNTFTEWIRPALRAAACSGVMTLLLALYLLFRRSADPVATMLPAFFVSAFIYQLVRLLISNPGLRSKRREPEKILILGSGRRAIKAWKELRVQYHRTKQLVGFVDNRDPRSFSSEIATRYVCDVDRLSDYLLRNVIDELIIAVPMRSCYDLAQRAVAIAEAAGVRVVTLNDTYGLNFSRGLRARTPLFVELVPKDEKLIAAEALKRSLDVVIAIICIAFTLPICAVIAVAIKLTSPGPILFVQDRYGYRRRLFPMCKFRSMVSNAPELMASLESQNEAGGPIFKITNDPRITSIGRFIRRTSLDELPQLWNVLSGDMSLVGPRPMSVRDVSLFTETQLMRRFSVRPGITGIWQVSGRSALSFEQWMALDFTYLDEWSLSLDFKILARTVPAVLKRSGAA